jgi:hypothetical protein
MLENAKMFARILGLFPQLSVNDVQYQERKSTVWYVSVMGQQKSPIMNFWMGANSYAVQFRHPEFLIAEDKPKLKKHNSKWLYASLAFCDQDFVENTIASYTEAITKFGTWR